MDLRRPILMISLTAAALIIGARQMGTLERWELQAYDQFVRLQPESEPDPRLLVVAITEADIQTLKQWPVSDQTLSQVLTKLEQYQPRVIGLDIYRDLPIKPGHLELKTDLQVNDKVIAVCQSGGSDQIGVAPPPTVPISRVGFSDLVVDPDGIVRRYLMFLTPSTNSKCRANTAFSLQLAFQYLSQQGIQWQKTPQEELQIGSTRFTPLQPMSGGYRNLDARGYQILLRYRSPSAVARQVSLQDLLKGYIDPSWVKDKIVLIGVTAASGNDLHLTPYSAGQPRNFRMPGVILHAQMVSQILETALEQQPLIWIWSEWLEISWFWGWALIGASLPMKLRHPLWLLASGTIALGVLTGSCWILFALGGWVPIIPPALAFGAAVVSAIAYKGYASPPSDETLRQAAAPTRKISLPRSLGSLGRSSSESKLTPEPGQSLLGRYIIIAPLSNSQGGFGKTYLAQDTKRPGNPECVVKHLQPRQTDPEHLEVARILFQQEAEILEAIGEHPQIPRLLAYFEESQEFYLVQEYIKGKALSELLGPDECWTPFQVVELLQGVLPVLDFIHRQGVIHRDLKPSNLIKRDSDGQPVLIDFGAVKLLQAKIAEHLTTDSPTFLSIIIIGTPGYAPPEQMLGQPSYNSDLYALGMVCIQALTGKHPTQFPISTDSGGMLWQDYTQIHQELAAILDKMTHPDPQKRFQNAPEILQQLQVLLSD